MKIHSYILGFIMVAISAVSAPAIGPGQIRFRNEDADTTKINRLLGQLRELDGNVNPSQVGRMLLDTPYAAGTLEGDGEMLTIDMEGFDCTTFAETVLALTITARERRDSWRDFAYNLEKLRYRNGTLGNYASRLHYMSDWVIDNNHRGIITDVTTRIGTSRSMLKTLDFMSRNRTLYPALADQETYEAIRDRENGFRSHNIPYLSANASMNASFREGDMVMLVTKKDGLDVTHVGFITMIDGTPHLLHASSKAKKVTIEKMALPEYLRRSPQTAGVRVIRLND